MFYIFVQVTTLGSTNYVNFDKIINSSTEENRDERLKDNIFVFISFSMSDNLISNYIVEARSLKERDNINVIFVLRGFYKNSFRETSNKINKLTDGKHIAMIVDPTLYEKYNVNQVPSIIKNNNNSYDKLIGSVTIRYALEVFEGDK